MRPPDAASLCAEAAEMGAVIDAQAAERILQYRVMLERWNKVYNLTAIREPAEMWTHHLLDSLAALGPLDRHADGRPLRLLDVGSGGGLPGAVLAMSRPDWDVTSIDAVGKKTGFVRQVALESGLRNLHAVHGRVERQSPLSADVVISRAFASLADFVRLTERHLAPGGVWVAMKGRRPDEEIAELGGLLDVFHVEHLNVPGLGADRHLIWMRRPETAIRSGAGGTAPASPAA